MILYSYVKQRHTEILNLSLYDINLNIKEFRHFFVAYATIIIHLERRKEIAFAEASLLTV